ncbi:MAG TPA: GNAT family N-acetyltransferase [Thermoplasmata archaeon]|nr:GNAT family N-acetyltransferase [Thermoplasmata archaeon]
MTLEIRPFTRADIPFGMMLTDAEEWYRVPADWARLLRIEPDGAFKAVADGIPAGTAAVLTHDRLAWVHSVIVLKELRHRGIGEALLRACLEFVDRRGMPTTKLDGVEGTEPFYARLGFREEYPSWRLLADGIPGQPKATRLRPKDHAAVLAYDRQRTGLDRHRALEAILDDYPDRAFLVRARGKIRGYIILRRGEHRDPVGPWVAEPDDPGTAAVLLASVLAVAGKQKLRMCVGGYQETGLRIAEELGFTRADHSTRMARGEPFEESRACYAMISAEKG